VRQWNPDFNRKAAIARLTSSQLGIAWRVKLHFIFDLDQLCEAFRDWRCEKE
jgi:hypothetical protein